MELSYVNIENYTVLEHINSLLQSIKFLLIVRLDNSEHYVKLYTWLAQSSWPATYISKNQVTILACVLSLNTLTRLMIHLLPYLGLTSKNKTTGQGIQIIHCNNPAKIVFFNWHHRNHIEFTTVTAKFLTRSHSSAAAAFSTRNQPVS